MKAVTGACPAAPPKANERFFLADAALAALAPFLTEIFVTKYPIWRIVVCASSSVAASMTSLISWPVASIASN